MQQVGGKSITAKMHYHQIHSTQRDFDMRNILNHNSTAMTSANNTLRSTTQVMLHNASQRRSTRQNRSKKRSATNDYFYHRLVCQLLSYSSQLID